MNIESLSSGAFGAAILGALASLSLLLGAAVGFWWSISQRVIAAIMAFGAGVLLSVVAFDLVGRALTAGGLIATCFGFVGGAGMFAACNHQLVRAGAQHRKRSGCNPCVRQDPTAPTAIALGALLDGVPESFVLGVSSAAGRHEGVLIAAALFLANFPEGLSSAAGMKRSGRSTRYIFGVWAGIVVASSVAAVAGHIAIANANSVAAAISLGIAAGAIMTMVVDTMLPEATEQSHELTGLFAASGFLASLVLSVTITGR